MTDKLIALHLVHAHGGKNMYDEVHIAAAPEMNQISWNKCGAGESVGQSGWEVRTGGGDM